MVSEVKVKALMEFFGISRKEAVGELLDMGDLDGL